MSGVNKPKIVNVDVTGPAGAGKSRLAQFIFDAVLGGRLDIGIEVSGVVWREETGAVLWKHVPATATVIYDINCSNTGVVRR